MSTVQVNIPSSSIFTQNNFKLKVRFFDAQNFERFDIQYSINPSGLMTIFLPPADTETAATFSGNIYFTQRKNN
jgi:hypothetical protein